MAAAVPVISAGVGIAGGIVGMFERSAEEKRQRELVNAQVQANQTAQDMQFAAIMQGQQMVANSYIQNNALRQQQFYANVMQHQQAGMQNTARHANTLAGLNTQETAALNQALAGNSQAVAKESEFKRAGTEAAIAALQQSIQLSDAELQAYQELRKQIDQGSAEYADFLSRTLGNESGPAESEATRVMANKLDREQYARMLQEFGTGEAVGEQALQQIVLSDEFQDLLEDVGAFEGNTIREQYNYALSTLINQINGQRNVTEFEYRTIADAIANSLKMEPVKNYIDQLSNNMNFLGQSSQLMGQAGGIAANTLNQNAQLLRGLPPQQSTLGGILSIVSAAAPLGSLFMNAPSSGLLSRPAVSLTQPLVTLPSDRPNVSLTRPLY